MNTLEDYEFDAAPNFFESSDATSPQADPTAAIKTFTLSGTAARFPLMSFRNDFFRQPKVIYNAFSEAEKTSFVTNLGNDLAVVRTDI
jgi:catalase